MEITQTELGPLNVMLHVKVEKADYESDFNAQLRKQQAEGHFKGFRKGKAPMGFIKKMYGQQMLAQAVNTKMQEGIFDYLKKEEIDMLGDPLMAEDQENMDFLPSDLKDYTFNFEIGYAPKFEVEGVEKSVSYTKHKVDISDDMIDEEVAGAAKRFGEQEEISDGIQEGDRIALSVYELADGVSKEGGHESSFTVFSNDLSDSVKDDVMKLKQGDTFKFDIYDLETGRDEEFVKKYFLQVEDASEIGKDFEAVIDTVYRLKEADVNMDLYTKMFGEGNVADEAEARTKVKDQIAEHYDRQSTSLMYRHILESLVEKNKMELPSDFLMKWLKWTNEQNTEEELEKGFDAFLDNLRWTLIKQKLAKRFEVEVTPQDIRGYLRNQIMGYLGAYATNEAFVEQMMEPILKDKQQVQNAYSEIEAERIFTNIHENITVDEKNVSIEEFKDLVKNTQQNS